MSSYQQQTHREEKTAIRQLILDFIAQNPSSTIAGIGSALGLEKSTVSARVNELKADGCLVVIDGENGYEHTYDPNKDNWVSRAGDLEREKRLSKIHKFVKAFEPSLTELGKQELRKLYTKVRSETA